MRISCNWLKNYIRTDLAPEKISDILTHTGLEVEGTEKFQPVRGGLEGFVIGLVKKCNKHPNADKLNIASVDIGRDENLQIICGAPNVVSGQKVLVALPGTRLYKGNESFNLKKTTIRGQISEGMICAEDEAGMGNRHEGIMVLDQDAKTGMPAKDYFDIQEDTVFEIGLTPNRIDGASHYGAARDLAACLSMEAPVRANLPPVNDFRIDNRDLPVEIIIRDKERCKRYSGITLTNIRAGDSPMWLKNRLRSIGLNPVNNIVDITNYVLHETGHPLHAFDADKIRGGKIIVQRLREGTKFTGLDEVERTLSSEDLMICDEQEGLCIAGVLGGAGSMVSRETKNLFIESAWFDPAGTRNTVRRHGLTTDASFRFERGADPNITIYALKRAAMLIRKMAGGKISSEIVDVYPEPIEHFRVHLNFEHMDRLAGEKINRDLAGRILESLEIRIIKKSGHSLDLEVPPYRVDVRREPDVIEEILRIYGYNKIPVSDKFNYSVIHGRENFKEQCTQKVSDLLTHKGCYEIMSNSLTRSAYYPGVEDLVRVYNPLSADLDCMRHSLLFGGLEAVSHNVNRQRPDLRLFEFGNIYRMNKQTDRRELLDRYIEEEHLALFLTGRKNGINPHEPVRSSSFYQLRSYVSAIFARLGIPEERTGIRSHSSDDFSEAITLSFEDKEIATLGILSTRHLKSFDLRSRVFYADLNWNRLVQLAGENEIIYRPVPRYPEVRRDLSMILGNEVKYEDIRKTVHSIPEKRIVGMYLFDVYEGKKIETGKKSYAISFVLQDKKQTLRDREIDKIMDKIEKALEKKFGARIRKPEDQ